MKKYCLEILGLIRELNKRLTRFLERSMSCFINLFYSLLGYVGSLVMDHVMKESKELCKVGMIQLSKMRSLTNITQNKEKKFHILSKLVELSPRIEPL